MKKQFKFFSVLFAAAAMMASCSNDEPLNPGTPGEDDPAYGDSYLSVSLMMPTSIGSRAKTDDENYNKDPKDNFDDGTAEESTVNNVFFFFFDAKNNVIDIQKFEDIKFQEETENNNPYVTSFGTREVRLKAGLDYSQVAVAINSSVSSASDFRGIKTLSDLEAHGHDYLGNLTKPATDSKNWGFVMSNSVYYDNLDEDGNSTFTISTTPTEDKKIILVPITEKNIYTSAERPNIATLIKDGTKKYVDIYVERVLAKVEVTSKLSISDYYVSDDNGKTQEITIYDNVNLTTRKVKVTPVILGASLNVLTNEAKLIKPLLANQVGYGVGNSTGYKDFKWNDPVNKRSYWANTEETSKDNMSYVSWNDVNGKNLKEDKTVEFSQYIHPNTQDYLPTADNENNSNNTKVMIIAQLRGKYLDENGKETGDLFDLDLVRYGSEYMEKSGFLAHASNYVAVAMRSESWMTDEHISFSAAEKAILEVLVPNSLADETVVGEDNKETVVKVITPSMFQIGKLSSDMNGAYEAVVSKSKDFAYTFTASAADADFFKYTQAEKDAMKEAEKTEAEARQWFKDPAIASIFMTEGALEALVAKANNRLLGYTEEETYIKGTVDKAIDEINKPQILYWKEGMTYFYTTIKQQGFYGLVGGGSDNYLNGVVRNHVYRIDLTGFYGLGTPVIDPSAKIDPERPEIERPSYLQARINVLPWRVVTQNATLH